MYAVVRCFFSLAFLLQTTEIDTLDFEDTGSASMIVKNPSFPTMFRLQSIHSTPQLKKLWFAQD